MNVSRNSIQPRPAFTLVEMLVATALVMLIMLLFAQVFSGAVGSLTTQQGIAHNDGKARVVEATLRRDLKKMTFRQPSSGFVQGIVALAPGDRVDERQKGYLYISENDPLDDTDDMIQMTVDMDITLRDGDRTKLAGRSQLLQVPPAGTVTTNPNQPEMDDGDRLPNGASASRAAEVVYFLRNGNLYRRVMLLRDPVRPSNGQSAFNEQPEFNLAAAPPYTRYFSGSTTPAFASYVPVFDQNAVRDNTNTLVGDFWNDFDFSCTRVPDANSPNGSLLHFNGYSSLDNGSGTSNYPLALPFHPPQRGSPVLEPSWTSNYPLALPFHRFGFAPMNFPGGAPNTLAGRSREFAGSTGTAAAAQVAAFMGRYLQEETSHPDFKFPGLPPTIADWQNPAVAVAMNPFGVSPALVGGPRAGEDLLLPNVEAFDIKVWDQTYVEPTVPATGGGFVILDINRDGNQQTAGAFVDIGNDFAADLTSIGQGIQALGSYSIRDNLNPHYGPFVALPVTPTPPLRRILDGALPVSALPTVVNPGLVAPLLPLARAPRNWNRVYDTWHPSYTFNVDGNADGDLADAVDGSNSSPPYRPLQVFTTPSLYDSTGLLNQAVAPYLVTTNLHRYWFNFGYLGASPLPANNLNRNPGDIYFPQSSNGSIGYRVVRSGEWVVNTRSTGGPFASYFDFDNDGAAFPADRAASNSTEPEWPTTPGATVIENGSNNDPSIPGTFLDDVVWEAFDNRIGLQMVQIQVRYRDQQSGLSRQVTIQHSFVE